MFKDKFLSITSPVFLSKERLFIKPAAPTEVALVYLPGLLIKSLALAIAKSRSRFCLSAYFCEK